MVLFGNGFEIGDDGISHDPNVLYGTQEVFGRGGFPPTPTIKLFLGDFLYFWDFGVGTLASLCIPYWPFVG